MPLYEYQCDACGHTFEVIQKMSDAPPAKCPVCGGVIHKMQSAPAFQFKGTGWYVTDYAKKDRSGSARTEGESKDGSKESAETGDKAEKSDKADKGDKADKTRDGTKSTTSSEAAPSTSGGASTTPTKTP